MLRPTSHRQHRPRWPIHHHPAQFPNNKHKLDRKFLVLSGNYGIMSLMLRPTSHRQHRPRSPIRPQFPNSKHKPDPNYLVLSGNYRPSSKLDIPQPNARQQHTTECNNHVFPRIDDPRTGEQPARYSPTSVIRTSTPIASPNRNHRTQQNPAQLTKQPNDTATTQHELVAVRFTHQRRNNW